MDIVSTVVWGAVTLAVPLLVAWLFILGRKALLAGQQYLEAHTTEVQRAFIWQVVNEAVLFAEQSGLVDALKATGAAKFDTALTYATAELDKKNVHIDPAALGNLIDGAVMQQFNKSMAIPVPVVVKAATVKPKPAPPPVPPVPPPAPPPWLPTPPATSTTTPPGA